jgi:CheY-like chemotaxis protein
MGLHVLLADDSSITRALLSEAVRASRVPIATILAVGDGAEALDALRDRRVDVLLTDIQMPKIDGLELVARISRSPWLDHVRVVTLSADANARRAVRASGRRVRAHLDKPIQFDSITALLSEIWAELQAGT